VPHLPEQDHRRPVGAPAQRAGLLPAAIDAADPKVLVVTGPSGVGKGTLIRTVRERFPGLELSVSATTRAPRPGEQDGVDYHFLADADFERRLEAGDFVEHAEYAGNRYGTPRSELDRMVKALVLEIEIQGAKQIKQTLPGALQVFILPPDIETLRKRLTERGTDGPDVIERRLARAREELEEAEAAAEDFPHSIVNDDLNEAVQELERLVATMWGRNFEGATE
jgi:guanylate kinase